MIATIDGLQNALKIGIIGAHMSLDLNCKAKLITKLMFGHFFAGIVYRHQSALGKVTWQAFPPIDRTQGLGQEQNHDC